MKLTQLFSGEVRNDNPARPSQPTPAQAQMLNRQIRSLVPGQTISGEILSRNGSEVQIKLSEDLTLNARVDRNMNIEVGKNMTFEVKNNGSALTLSPLFTNVATDVNVLKALDMAGLPVNQGTVDMTEQLMAAGMSVSKGILQQIFREINSFPQAEVADIISLHKLQLPVNEANVSQMASYRNLTHQLLEGMDAVLDALPEAFDSMVAEGDVMGAVRLYQEVLMLVRAGSGEELTMLTDGAAAEGTVKGTVVLTDIAQGQDPAQNLQPDSQGVPSARLSAAVVLAEAEAAGKDLSLLGQSEESAGTATTDAGLQAAVAREALDLLESLRLSPQEASAMGTGLSRIAAGEADLQQLFEHLNTLANAARTSMGSAQGMEKLLSGKAFRSLLSGALKEGWLIKPQELAEDGKVEELYRRLDRQLKGLADALEHAGQSGSTAFRAASAMSQNVDFLQQVNQMYSYVQLPLRLQQRDVHGDLYVYTNKKNLARKDGNVSALLHLDMEYLGPVDVYVAMQNSKVSTKFYLQDEEMIDFMAAHMDILTERLRKRGYDCSYSVTTRQDQESMATQGGLEPLLRQEKGVALSRYSFDVRT